MAQIPEASLNLQGISQTEAAWLGVGENSASFSIDVLSPKQLVVAGAMQGLWDRRQRIGVEAAAAAGIAGLTAATVAVGKTLAAESVPEATSVDPVYTIIIGYALAREPISTGISGALRVVDKRKGEVEQFVGQIELYEKQVESLGGEGAPEAARFVAQIKYFQQQQAMYTVQRLTSVFSGEAIREFAEGAMVALIRMGSPFVAIGLYELYQYMDAVGKNPNFNITGNPQIDAAAKLAIPAFAGIVGLGYGALWIAAEKRFWDIQAPGGGAGKAEEARSRREEKAMKAVQALAERKVAKARVAEKKEEKKAGGMPVQSSGNGQNRAGVGRRVPGTNRRVGQ